MQLSLIDPREHPVTTAEMLDDDGLKGAIKTMRKRAGTDPAAAWPYVEYFLDVVGRPAWAVDDGGGRYVAVGNVVFGIEDLSFAEENLRTEALKAFRRLDAGGVVVGGST
jgi:hypothetical protein